MLEDRLGPVATSTASQFVAPSIAAASEPLKEAPVLPEPVGTVVHVSSEAELQQAINSHASDMTIVVQPGVYELSRTLLVKDVDNLSIRGATNNPADVVLRGPGMKNAAYGNTPSGIWVGNASDVQIANMTLRDFYFHPVILNAGAESPHLYNLHLIDAGEQFVKSNPDGRGGGNDDGLVEHTVFEYTSTARSWYLGAIDVHTGDGWIIRDNVFRNIRPPEGVFGGTTIRMWNYSSNTLVEGNTFLNCQYGVALGLKPDRPGDHRGGIVRNNFFHRSSDQDGDVAIVVNHSADTEILHNTILLNGTYKNAIEYRFGDTTGTVIQNNLTDAAISARDGATGSVVNNVTDAVDSWFANAAAGDFHLTRAAAAAIDQAETLANARHDFDGESRPAGARADIGADEYLPPTSSEYLNFNDYEISSYRSDQDLKGTVGTSDDGGSLSLIGNRWVKIDFPYQINKDTVLEFDFRSNAQGEIHGIGFDVDDPSGETSRSRGFKLYGTQSWGIPDFADYSETNPESQHYVIPVGDFYQGDFQSLFFVTDHDVVNPTSESIFTNLRVHESRVQALDFRDHPVTSYRDRQDRDGNISIEDEGESLRITGNRWVKIDVSQDVTANTMLEFYFSSTVEGEIHGIGLDNQNPTKETSWNHGFQLFGTQSWGIDQFNDYGIVAPDSKRYVIPLGEFYQGEFQYLFFVTDHDVADPNAESVFSRVRIYEQS